MVLLAELDASRLQKIFTVLLDSDELSAATVRRVHSTLRTALNAAVREGLIADNPARYLELPRARRPHAVVWTPRRVRHWERTGQRPAVAVWTPAQTAQFLNAITYHPLHAAFHLIALRGLRRGEAAGLRWHDVDLENKVMYVTWQVQPGDATGSLAVCPLKTPASRRIVALDATTVAVLRAHRDAQQWACRANGVAPSGYVFTGPDGGPVSPDYLTRTFRQLVEGSGLPLVRLHDLRHGAASLSAGVELKVVQEMLGHSSIVLTADTYTSVLPDAAHAAAEKVAALIIKAGCLVPGTRRRRRRPARRKPRRAVTHAGRGQPGQARRSRAHPARQIGRPHRRRRTRLR